MKQTPKFPTPSSPPPVEPTVLLESQHRIPHPRDRCPPAPIGPGASRRTSRYECRRCHTTGQSSGPLLVRRSPEASDPPRSSPSKRSPMFPQFQTPSLFIYRHSLSLSSSALITPTLHFLLSISPNFPHRRVEDSRRCSSFFHSSAT